MLPTSIVLTMFWNDWRFIFVMAFTFGKLLRTYMPSRIFSSSMPVSAANASVWARPDSSKNASFVPSPWNTSAFGSSSDSSSHRVRSLSRIFTPIPASSSCRAR